MKKFAIKAIMVLGGLLMLGSTASAQMPLPVDPEVRIGHLPNGMTYYIRHNETPKGQADFYIAQKVGSTLEEDNQRGLAHFLEHMCFNGTESFPGNSLVSWLESVGVKFGYNLNAYTSMDETVYNISNVPTARESVQDSCLIILHDWADALLLDTEEINKERGVIHEEWRRTTVGQQRILENLLPKIYPDSKYGYRLPIGTMEVVDNFEPQALRDYYEAWYRPDQQGIIVVGDIDVDRIENKIKEIFSPIKMPENAKERVYLEVADTPGTIYAIGKDKEQTVAIAEMMFKNDAFPDSLKGDATYMVFDYVTDMISSMLNNRYGDMMSDPATPFGQAGANYGEFLVSKTKDALTIVAVAKDNDIRPAFESVYRELLRAQRGGFTHTEYDRARSEYLSRLEKAYNERGKRQSGAYVKEYVRHFIDNEPIPGIETEYQLMNALANQIPVEAINQTLAQMVTNDNRVFLALLPETEAMHFPTEAEIAEVISKVDAENIEPFVDDVKSEPLIENLPAPGKIVAEKALEQWGATELTLSNGVKVIVKPTTFKDDEILFDAIALGGTSNVSDDLANELLFMPYALRTRGLGSYTSKDLDKYLAGKQASVALSLSDYTREVEGSTTVKDLPTMMELLYMTFTNLTIDEAEYEALQKMLAGVLANQEKDPGFIFQRDLLSSLYSNPRKQIITTEILTAAKREPIVKIAHNATANAADYTFIFVGNIDMDKFKPLVEQYIATLPADAAKASKEIKLNPALQIATGNKTDNFTTPMETPQTWVAIVASSQVPYTAKQQKIASIAGQIMSKRLLDTVREEMGAVYSIGASGSLSRISEPNAMMQTSFPMKPEMKAEVLDFIAKEFKAMESNITTEELAKVVEFMVKNANEDHELNSPWINAISSSLINNVDTFNGVVDVLNSITVQDVQDYMKALNASGNYRVVIMDPAQ
ncbi:MAG: insulinase family protein [Muribaculaceae bacterium]|nr:insulinase family protein [Muribaculaceae bacterium]